MARRRYSESTAECSCPQRPAPHEVTRYEHAYTEHPNHCGCDAHGFTDPSSWELDRAESPVPPTPVRHHHFGCALWGPANDCYVRGITKPTKALLGSPRTPYAKWAANVSLYSWPLWRNWKPKPRVRVETIAQVRTRQIGGKPDGYSWKLWHQRADDRALYATRERCPGPAHRPITPTQPQPRRTRRRKAA